jgi:hypothetical protein
LEDVDSARRAITELEDPAENGVTEEEPIRENQETAVNNGNIWGFEAK